jgi:transglutaminase-like putative cysteine protease
MILAGVLTVAGIPVWLSLEGPAGRNAYPMERTVWYRYTLRNTTGVPVSHAEFTTFAPVTRTSWQWCDRIEATSHHTVEKDGVGNQILVFPIDSIPPYGTLVIRITVKLLFATTPQRLAEFDREACLVADPLFDVDASGFGAKGGVHGSALPRDVAVGCFDRVVSHLRYSGYRSASLTAASVVKAGEGDCTEFMTLLVAMCRKAGIPARGVAGYAADKAGRLKASDYHNWAELRLDGRWHVVDPQKRRFDAPGPGYVAMQLLGGNGRFASETRRHWVGSGGLSVSME